MAERTGSGVRTAQETGAGGAGGGGEADGVSIDGLGTSLDPFSVIPTYIDGLVGFVTDPTVAVSKQNHDIAVAGNAKSCIEVVGYVPNANAGASTLTLQPNALSTNGAYQETGGSAGTPNAASAASMVVGFAPATGFTLCRFVFFTQSGRIRFYFGSYLYLTNAVAISGLSMTGGRWNETAAAITSIRLHSDQATGIGAGSIFKWRVSN